MSIGSRTGRIGAFALLVFAAQKPAFAQDDGARLYMMVPDQTTIASLRLHRLHSNLAVDPGSVAEDAHLDTTLGVFQFVQALNFTGNQGFVFLVVPASRINASAKSASDSASKSISGFGLFTAFTERPRFAPAIMPTTHRASP
jgi:hypothetical protein